MYADGSLIMKIIFGQILQNINFILRNFRLYDRHSRFLVLWLCDVPRPSGVVCVEEVYNSLIT